MCGSDGVSYDSHCELHRAACNKDTHISPLYPGFCRGDREALIARQEFIQEMSLWDEDRREAVTATKIPLPDACFQNDRDRLREFIMNWFQISAKKQEWYSFGMSAGEELLGHFHSIDSQKGSNTSNSFLDTSELLNYLTSNKTLASNSDRMRHLCLDALLEEGDTNFDWRLSFSEFRRLLSPTYRPSRTLCTLNGKKFEDGAETAVKCNGCVCACGKWICTSRMCPDVFQDIINENMLEDSDESPEDDPHVKNIRWF